MATRRRTIQRRDERQQAGATVAIFLSRFRRVVDDCIRLMSSDAVPQETWTHCDSRLQALERNVRRASGTSLEEATCVELQDILKSLREEFRKQHDGEQVQTGYGAPRDQPTGGAPKYDISRDQLSFLIQCGFPIRRMSELLNVSVRTVKRRMRQYELKIQAGFTNLSDHDLDALVQECMGKNQRIGPNSVRARLFARGVKVQRQRVRESMLRLDPGGAALRAAPTIQRRNYTVAGPNSVWHIDGNHKLVRWRMIIHGAIDGFSRMMMFLKASGNNKKDTVLSHFLIATSLYGVPSRIRVDHGGENNDLCEVMELICGPDRGSAIRGRSVHNQRIERAWVDVWNGATNLLYDLFCFLEARGSLDIDNDSHMWALHYVFLPRLNRELQEFRNQWNNHGVRTLHHESPVQVFVGNCLELQNSNLTAMRDLFGHDEAAEPDTEQDLEAADVFEGEDWITENTVEVPELDSPIKEEALSLLQQSINPMAHSTVLGMDIYFKVLNFLEENVP